MTKEQATFFIQHVVPQYKIHIGIKDGKVVMLGWTEALGREDMMKFPIEKYLKQAIKMCKEKKP